MLKHFKIKLNPTILNSYFRQSNMFASNQNNFTSLGIRAQALTPPSILSIIYLKIMINNSRSCEIIQPGKFLCDIKKNRKEIALLTHQTASWAIKDIYLLLTSYYKSQVIYSSYISCSWYLINSYSHFTSSQAMQGFTIYKKNLKPNDRIGIGNSTSNWTTWTTRTIWKISRINKRQRTRISFL